MFLDNCSQIKINKKKIMKLLQYYYRFDISKMSYQLIARTTVKRNL